jgi:hypothetical protein
MVTHHINRRVSAQGLRLRDGGRKSDRHQGSEAKCKLFSCEPPFSHRHVKLILPAGTDALDMAGDVVGHRRHLGLGIRDQKVIVPLDQQPVLLALVFLDAGETQAREFGDFSGLAGMFIPFA